jgi:hypothetical protein
MKEKLKDEIAKGEVKVIELEDNAEAFKKIAEAFDIRGIPTILGVVVEEGKKKLCLIDKSEKNYGKCQEVDGVKLD